MNCTVGTATLERRVAKRAGNREQVLAIAESHMLDKGFGATSMEEIIAASALSRSGFFYHFRDRNELARALVERYVQQDNVLLDDLFARARELHDDPLHAFLIGLTLLSEMMADLPEGHPGCLVATFCYAERSFDRTVHRLNRQAMLGWRRRFVNLFVEIDARHPSPVATLVEPLADAFGTTVEGGIILSRAANCPRLLAEQLLLLRSHVKLLFASQSHVAQMPMPADWLTSSATGKTVGRAAHDASRAVAGGKREHLLDIAETGVLTKGYSATSIEELAAEAGITKGGFFYHFEDKQALAHALLQRTIAQDTQRLSECFAFAAAHHEDPYAQLSSVLDQLAEPRNGRNEGCHGSLVGTFCNTPGVVDEQARALLHRSLTAWREPFSEVLRHVAERYPPREEVTLDALVDRVFSTFEGGIVMAKSLGDPRVYAEQLWLLKSYFALLFPNARGNG